MLFTNFFSKLHVLFGSQVMSKQLYFNFIYGELTEMNAIK